MSVEIWWPEALSPEPAHDVEQLLEEAGLTASTLLVPTRRGPEAATVVVLLGSLLQPFAAALAQRAAGEVYAGLQTFVGRLLGRSSAEQTAPACVVFRSTATNAEFVFAEGLPAEAFTEAIALDPGERPGRWAWDPAARRWSRFEDAGRVVGSAS